MICSAQQRKEQEPMMKSIRYLHVSHQGSFLCWNLWKENKSVWINDKASQSWKTLINIPERRKRRAATRKSSTTRPLRGHRMSLGNASNLGKASRMMEVWVSLVIRAWMNTCPGPGTWLIIAPVSLCLSCVWFLWLVCVSVPCWLYFLVSSSLIIPICVPTCPHSSR